jgi:arabinose-5-phosphate isomerase
LGRRLLLTVEQLMHRDEYIPKVGPGTLLRDVIYEISSKKLGMTTVVDPSRRLLGVVTDGDLRRVLEQGGDNLLARTAASVMTARPKTILSSALAAEGLAQMERFSITALVVADAGGRVEGVVHLHDLLKAGIA